MAQQNLLLANEHLFARKGEAAPAADSMPGFGQSSFSLIPHNGSKQQKSKKRKGGKRNSSPLSSLIQRRIHVPEVSSEAGEHGSFGALGDCELAASEEPVGDILPVGIG